MKNIGSLFGIISLLVSLGVVAILVLTSANLFTGGKVPGKQINQPIKQARGIECLSNTRKIEEAAQIYLLENGKLPQTLGDLPNFSRNDFSCPVTGREYLYNPTTGKVFCPDHSHY